MGNERHAWVFLDEKRRMIVWKFIVEIEENTHNVVRRGRDNLSEEKKQNKKEYHKTTHTTRWQLEK